MLKKIIVSFLTFSLLWVSMPFTSIQAETASNIDKNLVLDVDFDGNVNDKSSFKTHGNVVGDVRYVDGIKGKAIHIKNGEYGSKDSTEAIQYVNFKSPKNLQFEDQDFSISFWFQSEAHGGDGAAVISNKNYSSGGNTGFTVGLFGTGLRLNFTPQGSGRKDIYGLTSPEVMSEGWHHYVFNFDRDDKVSVYIDGVKEKEMNIKDSPSTIDAGFNFVLGASGNFHNGITDGKYDELKVYKSQLTQDDAKTLYLDGLFYQQLEEAEQTISEYSIIEGIDKNLLNNLKTATNNLKEQENYIADISNYEQTITLIASVNAAVKALVESTPIAPAKGQVLYLDFENDVKDKSGLGHHGTLVNKDAPESIIEYRPGVVGNSLYINSRNGTKESNTDEPATEYIDLPLTDDLKFGDGDFGIAMWVKLPTNFNDNSGAKASAFISNKNWVSGANKGFVLGSFGNGFTGNYVSDSGERKDTRRIDIADNQWHFITANVDRKGSLSLYIDNELATEVDISSTSGSIDVENQHWVIGADAVHSAGISEAHIDELRMFNRMITKAERDELYGALEHKAILRSEIEEAQAKLDDAKASASHSEKRIAELEAGINYLNAEIEVADEEEAKRLSRDLLNMLDRFEQKSEPLFSFNAVTDTHIDRGNGEIEQLDDYLRDIRWLNPDSKVIMNSGDFTDSGKESEYKKHYELLEKNKVEGRAYINALGNHDVRWLCSPSNPDSGKDPTVPTCPEGAANANLWKERYLKYNAPYMGDDWDQESVFHKKWIDDYLFIVINTEADLKDWAYISDEQIEWLDKTLEESDPNKPVFIAMHQILEGTADYEKGDLIGEADAKLKEVFKKHPQVVLLTGHIHSTVDRSDVYHREWGHLFDMASFSYAYTSGADRRNQVGYQIDVYEDQIKIRPRDHGKGEWLPQYNKTFWIDDPLPKDPSDDHLDIDVDLITPTAGNRQADYKDVSMLFDNDADTYWHSKWSGSGSTRDETWVNMSFEELTEVAGFRYLPRSGAGNGTIKAFDIEVSKDFGETYNKIASGEFSAQPGWKLFEFEKVEVTDVRVQITENVGSGIYGSGAEMRLIKDESSVLRQELKELLDKANDKVEEYYTEETFAKLVKNIDLATTVANDSESTIEDLNTSINALDDSLKQLLKVGITQLQDEYEMVFTETITLDPKPAKGTWTFDDTAVDIKYESAGFLTKSSSKITITPLKSGKTTLVYAAPHGVEKTVDLLISVDISKLSELLEISEDKDLKGYTPDSIKIYHEILEKGRLTLESPKNQSSVDEMVTLLESADQVLVAIADTTELASKLINISKLEESDYTEDTWRVLSNCVETAQELIANKNATQSEVDTMLQNLQEAVYGLIPIDYFENYALLKKKVDELKEINKEGFTDSSWSQFEDTLQSAEDILEKSHHEISALELLEMYEALSKASDELVTVTFKNLFKELREKVNEYDQLKSNDYTEDSWKHFKEVLEEAKNMLEYIEKGTSQTTLFDEPISESTLKDMIDRLDVAYRSLVKANKTPSIPNNKDPEKDKENMDSDKDSGIQGAEKDKEHEFQKDTPNTAVESIYLNYVLLIIVAIGILFVRKRQEN